MTMYTAAESVWPFEQSRDRQGAGSRLPAESSVSAPLVVPESERTMQSFEIVGGHRLKGSVEISGAKNAALPIMAASILVEGEIVLHNVPDLADVRSMQTLLARLGVKSDRRPDGAMTLRVEDEMNAHAEYELVSKMRASVCVMGPLLAKRRRAQVAMPGGCAIGDRPIDLHVLGLRCLGAESDFVNGDVLLRGKKLKGAEIFLGGPFGSSVTATANVMMAATLAEGRTVIASAACEPEVVDLANFLIACGARITGQGTPEIFVEGVSTLHGVSVSSTRRLEPTVITTQPYPGFPTDLQAQAMALLCLADGNSVITEKIYPDRFLHVGELNRMGAQLHKEGPTVIIEGPTRLVGAPVMASDLRASAALILAGLIAKGTTRIHRAYHIDRGYEKIEEKLTQLGAVVRRVNDA